MNAEQKKTLSSDSLYNEYISEFNNAKAAFRDCVKLNSVDMWAQGVAHMHKADKINLMRLALV